ncbi:HEPN domain-containing protein [Massilia sp. CCM 8734]|uniref:HEPN domain-containing protein n=1 Tax=Massilia sp. CCM 8734 TaxID=2609283 RepID=UPI00141F418C|nr:HEPN domain-containing protein [Massilia sp. CCM 8734]
MPYPMHILLNDFAIRSFRETADKDYVAARMAYRARLIQPFLWSSLHCLEKYIKGILVLNRVKTQNMGHSVLPGIERMKQHGKFELDLSVDTVQFIKKLEEYGAEYRYYEVSYETQPFDVIRFDRAVWELRRYCQPLDYDIIDLSGKTVNFLAIELERIHQAKANHEKGTCIMGGFLEDIIKKKDHPAREALIWNNLFFGPSRRKRVKMQSRWESGSSPFFLHPQIIDEVLKYAYIPGKIAEGVRQFARQKAAEEVKAERDAKKAARATAKQSGKKD